jgi:hypothetical protein
MSDLYRDTRCGSCGGLHALYDTSALRHRPGGVYEFSCPDSGRRVRVSWLTEPEVVAVLPDGAVPMQWVDDAEPSEA